MRNLFPFHLGNVIRKLNQIRIAINLQHQKPFPKSENRLLSYYCFVSRRIKINPSGEIAGGLSRFVTSLIDFSFVRSICASAYSSRGGHAYDPVSLFLLELFLDHSKRGQVYFLSILSFALKILLTEVKWIRR